MPRDAKFGLVVGIGVVILMTVIFFRREPVDTATDQAPTTTAKSHVTTSTSPGIITGVFKSEDEPKNKIIPAVNRNE